MEPKSKPNQPNLELLAQIRESHNLGDISYRVGVYRELAKTTGARQVVLWDDVAFAIPEDQRDQLHGLPGYERGNLPGLLMAAGFDNGAKVLVSAPPNPVERRWLLQMKEALEQKLGRKISYQVLMPQEAGDAVDLMSLEEQDYYDLCLNYASQRDELGEHPQSISLLLNWFSKNHQAVTGGEKTLAVPFQTTQTHYDELSESNEVVLPDVPDLDKIHNNFLLRKNGFVDIPMMIAVAADGEIVTDHDQYSAKKALLNEKDTGLENILAYAGGIISAIDRFKAEGKAAYVKLDSNGVSGLGNLDPDKYPTIYDSSDYGVRVAALVDLIQREKGLKKLPVFAAVEEKIRPAKIEGMTTDYTVCGQLIDGVFYPTSVNPFGTTQGVYDREWVAAQAEQLGEDPLIWGRMMESFGEMGRILANEGGYKNGILAGDVFVTDDGRLMIHDFNFRRGGRSTPEALMAIVPETAWFEAQVVVDLQNPELNNQELFKIYTRLANNLLDQNILPFSTSFGYFGVHGKDRFVKLKLMVPMNFFGTAEAHVPRDQQLEFVEQVVQQLLTKNE